METTSLCILPRLRACSNDRSLLNCKGKYTKSELDSGVYWFLCDPSATGSKVHELQQEIYNGSWETHRLALLPYGFEHQFTLTYSTFKGLLSFDLHSALNFWVLCIQSLHFQSHRWSRPLFFIPSLRWVHGAKAEDRNFWEGAAHWQCDSNGHSVTAL